MFIDIFLEFIPQLLTLTPFYYFFATLCFLGVILLIKELAQW